MFLCSYVTMDFVLVTCINTLYDCSLVIQSLKYEITVRRYSRCVREQLSIVLPNITVITGALIRWHAVPNSSQRPHGLLLWSIGPLWLFQSTTEQSAYLLAAVTHSSTISLLNPSHPLIALYVMFLIFQKVFQASNFN